jgi:hypothetical protein
MNNVDEQAARCMINFEILEFEMSKERDTVRHSTPPPPCRHVIRNDARQKHVAALMLNALLLFALVHSFNSVNHGS